MTSYLYLPSIARSISNLIRQARYLRELPDWAPSRVGLHTWWLWIPVEQGTFCGVNFHLVLRGSRVTQCAARQALAFQGSFETESARLVYLRSDSEITLRLLQPWRTNVPAKICLLIIRLRLLIAISYRVVCTPFKFQTHILVQIHRTSSLI